MQVLTQRGILFFVDIIIDFTRTHLAVATLLKIMLEINSHQFFSFQAYEILMLL